MVANVRDRVRPSALGDVYEPVEPAERAKLLSKFVLGPVAVATLREQAQRIVGEVLRWDAHLGVVPRFRLKPILQLGG